MYVSWDRGWGGTRGVVVLGLTFVLVSKGGGAGIGVVGLRSWSVDLRHVHV